jgi:hypothetical protein
MQIDDELSVVINLLVPKLIRAFIKRPPLVSVATSSALHVDEADPRPVHVKNGVVWRTRTGKESKLDVY